MKTIIILIFLVSSQFCNSQPSITWNRIYDGPRHYDDGGVSICQSDSGNYFVFGYTYTGVSGRVFILKINEYGDTLWSKIFTNIDDAITSISTDDGGCIFAGGASSSALVKMDANGNIIWIKNYLPQRVTINNIRKTSNGYICCGVRFGFFDGYVLKVKFDGTLEWEKIFPASLQKEFYSVELADDGEYIISGFSADFQGDIAKVLVLKLDTLGNFKWEKKYLINNRGSYGGFITNTKNGYTIIGGTSELFSSNSQSRIFMMRLNNNGDSTLTKIFPFYKNDDYANANKVNENKFIATSFVFPDTVNGKVILFDSLGNVIAQKTYYSRVYMYYSACLPLPNGDIILTGTIKNYVHNIYEDLIITRADSMLNAPIVNISQTNSEVPEKYYLYQNYPNPFNPTTKIRFDLPKNGKVKIQIYNALGKLMSTLLNKFLNRGTYEIDFNGKDLSSGIYFYMLTSEDEKAKTRKMLLLK